MNKEIKQKGKLLNDKGELTNPGYSTSLIQEYSRNDIKAKKFKIKEWDYYLIYNKDYAIALTIDDNSYMGLMSVSVIDFKNQREKTVINLIFSIKEDVSMTHPLFLCVMHNS